MSTPTPPIISRPGLRPLVVVLLVTLVTFGNSGCSTSVQKLAKGKGELATDARAVLAALAKSKQRPKQVLVWTAAFDAMKRCKTGQPCAGVLVENQRIVELITRHIGSLDLAPLSKATALRQLDLAYSDLEVLSGLEGLPALHTIKADHNKLARVEKLRKLPKLRSLDLSNNPLAALETLEDLPLLTDYLKFESKALTTVAGWKNVGVTSLDFDGSKLTTLARLTNLPALRRLSARGAKLTSVELAGLPRLESLVVKQNQLTRLSVKAMPKLTVINATGNRLPAVELGALPALTHLALSKNKLTAVPTVAGGVAKLAWLDLSSNQLTSLVGLEALAPAELFVDHNQLHDLALRSGPAEAPAPKQRKQGKGGKAAAASGPRVAKLVTLRADHNQIASLDGIEAYPALLYLYLDHNKLTSLAGIEQATKLKKVHVSHNQLTTLRPLPTTQLVELLATDNKLSDRKELFGRRGNARPTIARYDVRRNAWVGVGAVLLFWGLASPSYYGLYKPSPGGLGGYRGHGGGHYRGGYRGSGYRGSGYRGSGYRGSRGIRSSGTRYSGGGGGYRTGK